MKKVNIIIEHLFHLPEFKPLCRYNCYREFVKLLNKRHQKAISFVYVKRDILFVVPSHPIFKMELNYNKKLLRKILNEFLERCENCKNLEIGVNGVVIVNSHKKMTNSTKDIDTIPYYPERSDGDFEIKSRDIRLKKIFQRIQNGIKKSKRNI